MKQWYVIQTKPKKEGTVARQFNRAHYEYFFPQIRGMIKEKPLFPSYLFVRSDFKDPQVHRNVHFTRGVRGILGCSEGPIPVPDLLVETLKERTRNGSLIEQDLLFKEGDLVRVKRGILKDLAGIIEKNMPVQGRIRVLFRWLNSRMQAVFKYTELEKA